MIFPSFLNIRIQMSKDYARSHFSMSKSWNHLVFKGNYESLQLEYALYILIVYSILIRIVESLSHT